METPARNHVEGGRKFVRFKVKRIREPYQFTVARLEKPVRTQPMRQLATLDGQNAAGGINPQLANQPPDHLAAIVTAWRQVAESFAAQMGTELSHRERRH